MLFLNPADDEAFRSSVEELLRDEVRGHRDFERRLRQDYPSAVVRPRDLASEPLTVWYIYRDGHWVGVPSP